MKRQKKREKEKENENQKGQEKRKRPIHTVTGLATSWHHFTWPPPQHQATQRARGE